MTRDLALVTKQLPGGRWIYGIYRNPGSDSSKIDRRPYVEVFEDQGWWVGRNHAEQIGGWGHRNFEDREPKNWHEIYESDGDPMWLREKVLGIFEAADIHVLDVQCPEGKTEEIEELYVEDHDRTRTFMKVYEAICKAEKIEPKMVRYDVIVKPTVEESPKKE